MTTTSITETENIGNIKYRPELSRLLDPRAALEALKLKAEKNLDTEKQANASESKPIEIGKAMELFAKCGFEKKELVLLEKFMRDEKNPLSPLQALKTLEDFYNKSRSVAGAIEKAKAFLASLIPGGSKPINRTRT